MQYNLNALHVQFTALDWVGVASFAETVIRKRFDSVPMKMITRACAGGISETSVTDSMDPYSVRCYLSDLYSRRERLSIKEIADVNAELARFGTLLQRAVVTWHF